MSSKHFKGKKRKGICLVVWTDAQERIRDFELSGHAGYADEGPDIVCASVSALSITACNGLEYFLLIPPKLQVKDGYLSCRLENIREEELEKAQWILRTMVLGIEQIQAAYGRDYIYIDRRRWTPC